MIMSIISVGENRTKLIRRVQLFAGDHNWMFIRNVNCAILDRVDIHSTRVPSAPFFSQCVYSLARTVENFLLPCFFCCECIVTITPLYWTIFFNSFVDLFLDLSSFFIVQLEPSRSIEKILIFTVFNPLLWLCGISLDVSEWTNRAIHVRACLFTNRK